MTVRILSQSNKVVIGASPKLEGWQCLPFPLDDKDLPALLLDRIELLQDESVDLFFWAEGFETVNFETATNLIRQIRQKLHQDGVLILCVNDLSSMLSKIFTHNDRYSDSVSNVSGLFSKTHASGIIIPLRFAYTEPLLVDLVISAGFKNYRTLSTARHKHQVNTLNGLGLTSFESDFNCPTVRDHHKLFAIASRTV